MSKELLPLLYSVSAFNIGCATFVPCFPFANMLIEGQPVLSRFFELASRITISFRPETAEPGTKANFKIFAILQV